VFANAISFRFHPNIKPQQAKYPRNILYSNEAYSHIGVYKTFVEAFFIHKLEKNFHLAQYEPLFSNSKYPKLPLGDGKLLCPN